jgi:hypothetical protein
MAKKKKPTGQSTGVLGDIWGGLEAGGEAFGEGTEELGKDIWDVTAADKPGEAVAKKLGIVGATDPTAKKKAKKKAATTTPEEQILQAISNYLTSNVAQGEEAMGEEGQQLAQQNAAVTGTVDQFLTGTNSGSAAVNAAQDAYAKAYSSGEGLNSAAYANMGAANAEYVASAPMAPIINLLTQGLGSGQYKEIPASLVASLPQSVRDALAAAGVTQTTGTGEGNPIPTGKSATTATGSALLNAVEQQGVVGTANPASGITANTNPSTPGA